jgi:regulator of sirC expression with transglutaminase-like and TPR domain
VRNNKDLATARPTLEKSYNEVKRALQLNPDLAAAHLLKGNLLLRVGRTPDALTEFDVYLRLEPKGAWADETRALVDKIKTATSHNTPKP